MSKIATEEKICYCKHYKTEKTIHSPIADITKIKRASLEKWIINQRG